MLIMYIYVEIMMRDIVNSTCDISYVDAFILYYDTSYDYNDVDDCIVLYYVTMFFMWDAYLFYDL